MSDLEKVIAEGRQLLADSNPAEEISVRDEDYFYHRVFKYLRDHAAELLTAAASAETMRRANEDAKIVVNKLNEALQSEVELRNIFYVQRVAKAEARVAKLEAALKKYGRHKSFCACVPCDCGLATTGEQQ